MSDDPRTIYLDHAATTPPAPEVVSAMRPYTGELFGNPSALYRMGRDSRAAIEEAREKVAALIGASPGEVFFTSGGSESDNMALIGTMAAAGDGRDHLVTTTVEHHAVLETAHYLAKRGFEVAFVDVDPEGMVDPGDIAAAIRSETALVSVMHANNEVGTIEPIEEIARICRERGVLLHTDAVQTVGNVPVDVGALGVDLLSMSGHKLYGPKGIGAIFVRSGTRIDRFIHGGEQEHGMRAGTENLSGIVGLGAAAELAAAEMDARVERITRLRDLLIEGLSSSIEGVVLNGHPIRRLPNNVHVTVRLIEGEAICLQLDTLGICASAGSACTSEALEPSHVLLAMGIPGQDAQGAVRFSLGRDNTEEDVAYVLEKLPPVVERLRSMTPLTF